MRSQRKGGHYMYHHKYLNYLLGLITLLSIIALFDFPRSVFAISLTIILWVIFFLIKIILPFATHAFANDKNHQKSTDHLLNVGFWIGLLGSSISSYMQSDIQMRVLFLVMMIVFAILPPIYSIINKKRS